MTNYSFTHIAEIVNGRILQLASETHVEQLVIDSRKIIFPSNSLFFALHGPRRDGHLFIHEAYNKGIRNFIVSKTVEINNWRDANFILVSDALSALQKLAAFHRKQFILPVIGITGSNGKTIVKEWLNQLLEEDFNIVRSPKSFNSQLGVPLSVWQLDASHELGIFEAGISEPGEMRTLESIIQPTIGLFTNIGPAHSEGFASIEQKIKEKTALFQHSDIIIYSADEKRIQAEMLRLRNSEQEDPNKQIQLFSWGHNHESTLQLKQINKSESGSLIEAMYMGQHMSIQIPFNDEASIHNAMSCWCVMLYLQIPQHSITKRMMQLQQVSMRLELKRGINHCTIINDSYSADLSSLNIALDLLNEQRQHRKQTAILSDFLQSGLNDEQLYSQIAAALMQHNVHRVIGLGENMIAQKEKFASIPQQSFYHSTGEFKANFREFEFYDEAILLKGARVFAFEEIDRLLAEKLHQTVLEINLDALVHNLKQYQQLLQPNTKVMAMVKAFSYGSGSYEIANTLQFNKVDFLSVAYADEGVELRKAGISIPIMVMNVDESSFPLLSEYLLQPVVYSIPLLFALEQFLLHEGASQFPIHVEINSGMNRLGFEPDQLDGLTNRLNSSIFKVISVFSHFAASEEPQQDRFSEQQIQIFLHACDTLARKISYPFLKHISNTAAVQRHPEWQFDMVRLGIGLYGIDTSMENHLDLLQVSTLKTTIAQLRKIRKGETISYGRHGVALRDSIIATVRLGYADGYPRSLSNGRGKMFVKGKAAPIIGTICMDMTIIDVTDIPGVEEADEVIVFGKELPVQQVSRWADTIPYEILTGVSQRVKRVYFRE
jgi:alanine racemase